jgi:hypothetical protein
MVEKSEEEKKERGRRERGKQTRYIISETTRAKHIE